MSQTAPAHWPAHRIDQETVAMFRRFLDLTHARLRAAGLPVCDEGFRFSFRFDFAPQDGGCLSPSLSLRIDGTDDLLGQTRWRGANPVELIARAMDDLQDRFLEIINGDARQDPASATV